MGYTMCIEEMIYWNNLMENSGNLNSIMTRENVKNS